MRENFVIALSVVDTTKKEQQDPKSKHVFISHIESFEKEGSFTKVTLFSGAEFLCVDTVEAIYRKGKTANVILSLDGSNG